MATRGRAARQQQRQKPIPFAHKLVLNQWLLSLFNVKRFEEIVEFDPLTGQKADDLHLDRKYRDCSDLRQTRSECHLDVPDGCRYPQVGWWESPKTSSCYPYPLTEKHR